MAASIGDMLFHNLVTLIPLFCLPLMLFQLIRIYNLKDDLMLGLDVNVGHAQQNEERN